LSTPLAAKTFRGNSMTLQQLSAVSTDASFVQELKEEGWSYFNREFTIAYHPLLSLSGDQTLGFQIALGWHQQRSPLYKSDNNELLAMLDDTGLTLPLRSWLLHAVVKQLYVWRKQYVSASHIQIVLPVSEKQWRAPGMIETLQHISRDLKWRIQGFTLEITQTTLLKHSEWSTRILSRLATLGIPVQISHCSPTHAACALLHHFGIKAIKLDPTFIQTIALSQTALQCFQKVLNALALYPITVTTPSFETPEQLHALTQIKYPYWCIVCTSSMTAREAMTMISDGSQSDQSTLGAYFQAMSRLSQYVQKFLGAAIVTRYWQSTRPQAEWLAHTPIGVKSTQFFLSHQEMVLSQQQIQDLEVWVKCFILSASSIIRDLPHLLLYSGLTIAESQLLRLESEP
jgi:EAL domain-containing protein (putative c-di-GMP-specific phosphodiesterase class I)